MKKLLIGIILLFAQVAIAGPRVTGYSPGQLLETTSSPTFAGITASVKDYQYLPIDAGMDSVIAAPAAAARISGNAGSQTIASWTGGATSYDTLTTSGADITAAVYTTAGTQSAVTASIVLTTGKLYHILATETHTSGAHMVLSGTGGVPTTTLAAGANNIYFRATAAATILTVSNTSAASNACTFTMYEYTRPAIAREYLNSTQQSLIYDWMPPKDWNAGTITFTPYGVVTNATAPANTETIIMSISGFCVPTSGSLSTATGTAVTSTFTSTATYVQYDEWIGAETAAITLPGAAAGSKCRLMVDRLTTDTYEQAVGVTGGLIKFTRALAP
ncbi:MAG: hypothetical protein ACYDG4_13280 [Desulfuromonadaceae bacterium]